MLGVQFPQVQYINLSEIFYAVKAIIIVISVHYNLPTLFVVSHFLRTVNSLYIGHCKDLELVSSLARVRNRGSLFLFAWDLAVVRIIGVSVVAGCRQGES